MSISKVGLLYVPSPNSSDNNYLRDVVGNKLDDESGNSLYSHSYMFEKHIHNDSFIRPYLGSSVLIQKASGTWAAFPTPTQIIAAGDIIEPFDLHFLNISNISANGEYQIGLFYGPALSETLVNVYGTAKNAIQSQEGSRVILTRLFPANTRISVALTGDPVAQETLRLFVEGHTY
jgi:hypothetical protein